MLFAFFGMKCVKTAASQMKGKMTHRNNGKYEDKMQLSGLMDGTRTEKGTTTI